MSWQSYVDDQVNIYIPLDAIPNISKVKRRRISLNWMHFQLLATKMVSEAAIAGHDGNIWAKSANFNCTTEEVKKILGSWETTDTMAMNGITVNALKWETAFNMSDW